MVRHVIDETPLADVFAAMAGKVIVAVDVSGNKDRVVFSFEDGTYQLFGVDAECCSTSWIEHLEAPLDVVGATITGAEDGEEVPITQDHSDHDEDEDHGDVCVNVYNTVFHTNKGDIVLEYRNSSNGHYGGELVPLVEGA